MRGEIVAGPHVRNACRRHLDDLKNGPARGLIWDVAAANRFIGYCRDVLRLNGGQFEGKPFILQPSQAFIAGSIFGWKRTNDEGKIVRRFRRAYIEQAKGQGKSPLAGAIGLYCMTADGEAAAEIYAAGKDKAQAFVLFRDSVAMYEQSPALKARLTPSGGNPIWNLADLRTRSFYRPISREQAHSGPRPYVALCDEIHEHPDGNTLEMLERGFKFRDQPLLLMITNSGSDRNSVCWAEHQWAVKVAAGTDTPDEQSTYVGDVFGTSDECFSYVCSLDVGDDPFTDPSCWIKANPLLGVTLKYEYIEGVVAQARDIPSKRNNILRLHFCVWTESDTAWIPRPILERVMVDFDPYEEHAGKPIAAAGLDLSGAKDLTAAAFVVETGTKRITRADGTEADLPTFDLWIEAFTPRDTMDERSKVDHVPYRLWFEQGYINAPEGSRVRYDHVAALFARLNTEHGIGVLAYDNYAFDKFAEELDAYGVEIQTVNHPQGGKKRAAPSPEKVAAAEAAGLPKPLGLWMPGSVAALEELILEERIRLRRSPVLLGALMGVAIETDPLMGNQWFSKKKSTVRIDPAVASAMAVGAAVDGIPEPVIVSSPWDDPEFSINKAA
ncbi:terminase large subunit [Rhizobium sp. 12,4]|uniref:terminase large subunit n=1 Tax=Rhizobium sp. 12,4 TaxID=3405135 RepID=UPI003D32EB15